MESYTQLPSLESELKIHEKRMRTVHNLEKALDTLTMELKDINVNCPFGVSNLEVQELVSEVMAVTSALYRKTQLVHNYIQERHINDVEIFSHNENLLPSAKERLEDTFASLKSGVFNELEASRSVREGDAMAQQSFENTLNTLHENFKQAVAAGSIKNNKDLEHYSVID